MLCNNEIKRMADNYGQGRKTRRMTDTITTGNDEDDKDNGQQGGQWTRTRRTTDAGNLVWIQGPYPVGKYSNIIIFNKVLRHFLEPWK